MSMRHMDAVMNDPALPLWRMTRARYERLVEAGIFGPGDKVELLDGLLVAREPQDGLHAMAVGLVRASLERAFGRRFHVREEKPVALDDVSEPEPDVVVVRGRLRDYRTHPSKPVLVVEVADSSLVHDRVRKGGLYARAGIAEYWVLNLLDEVIEVYREPVGASSRHGGWKYTQVQRLKRNATITPLGAPGSRIRVAFLLP
ncbi:MAG: Uma2 family endonuclease [Candidatus Rokubacteria bacterium]|nr:Uma2 family endonuclease [Candidatus Rokubacteria bacterium]